MKSLVLVLTLMAFCALLGEYALGATERISTKDKVVIGAKTSTANKIIAVEKGDGSQPALRYNVTNGAWEQSNDGTSFGPIGSGAGGAGGVNLLKNNGAESGLTDWTNSGGTFSQQDYTNPSDSNKKYFRFVASGASQYVQQIVSAWPDFISGGCMADIKYLQGDNAFEYKVIQDPSGSPVELSSGSISDLTSWLKAPTITFPCPSAGSSVALRIISTGAGTIDFDEAYLGSSKNISPVGKMAHFVGSIEWQVTANCRWILNTTGFSSYSADADCDDNPRTILGEALESASTPGQLPVIRFPYLKAGHYKIVVTNLFEAYNGTFHSLWRISNGVVHSNIVDAYNGSTSGTAPSAVFSMDFTEDQTSDTELEVQGRVSNATGSADILAIEGGFKITVYYYPTGKDTVEAFTPEQADFFSEFTIGGGNSTTNSIVSTPTEVAIATWDLVNKRGAPAQIACLNGTESSGLTCPTAFESLGFSLNFPLAGKYEVCATIPTEGGSVRASWRVYRVHNVSGAILETGHETALAGAVTVNVDDSMRICPTFDVPSVGKHTFKVLYEQSAANNFYWLGDRSASYSEREFYFRVRMLGHNVSRPIIQNMVDTSLGSGVRTESCRINNSGTASIDTTSGLCESWIDTTSRTSSGVVYTYIKSGIFSGRPVCTCSAHSNYHFCNIRQSTDLEIETFTGYYTGSSSDNAIQIHCKGKR